MRELEGIMMQFNTTTSFRALRAHEGTLMKASS